MRLIKIALGSVNPTVGSVHSNTARCIAQAKAMAAADSSTAAIASGARLRRMAGLKRDSPRRATAGIAGQCIA